MVEDSNSKITVPKISLTISCYNEEEIILNTYQKLISEMRKLNEAFEIIFCNDGSTDNTLMVLNRIKENGKNIKIISYYPNRGFGYASRQLYKATSGEVIIQMDADLAMKPEDTLPTFIREIKDADIIIGSRYTGIKAEYPLYRLIFSKLNLWLNKILFDCPFKDTNSGFYAMRREVLNKIRLICCDFEISAELFIKAKMNNFKIKEIPIKFIHKTEFGQINVIKHSLKILVDILKLWIDLRIKYGA